MMKLRFNLDELVPAIASNLAQKKGLISLKPLTWTSRNYEQFFKQKRGLVSGREYQENSNIEGVRYIKSEKGHTLFYDEEAMDHKELQWCEADLKHMHGGFTHRIILKKTMKLQLHVSDKGIVRFRSGKKGIRCLSLKNVHLLQELLCKEDAIRLLTLPCHQQWVEDVLLTMNSLYVPMANNLIRSCSSFQQFINRVNPTMHKISAKKLRNLGFQSILEIMKAANQLQNPHELLENVEAYFQEKESNTITYQLLEDYLSMMARQKEKAWFSLNRECVRKHHDKAVLQFLDTTTVNPIHISPVAFLFKTYFPGDNYELITDGARLKKEGIIQHHCVASYDNKINDQRCFIISVLHGDERFTGEIQINMKGSTIALEVVQFRGFANCSVPGVLDEELQKIVDMFNTTEYKHSDIININACSKKITSENEYKEALQTIEGSQ